MSTTYGPISPVAEEDATETLVLLRDGSTVILLTTTWRERDGWLFFHNNDPKDPNAFAVFPPGGWVGLVQR